MTNYDTIRPVEMGACCNAPPTIKKPKLLIIGHARHGKDTFADLVVEKMNLSFISSSEFVGRECIWEQWGKERYTSFSDFFEDRVNHRGLWYNFIVAYNTPNLARTGEEMMASHDVYVGMRNPDEFYACTAKNIFDYVIWVDGSSRHPLEPKDSMGLTADMADMHIDNNGPESNLHLAVGNLQRRLHDEGFDVDWTPLPNAMTEEQTALALTANCPEAFGEDPYDPPIQKPLAINSDKPMLSEYVGIINPPVIEDKLGAILAKPLKCNGDCGCEDGSLCHENVCGPRAHMIVNPTLEESRKFHNDALMATCDPKESWGFSRTSPSERSWTDMPAGAVQVLDHGFFKVLEVMGSDETICESARMSYGRGTKKARDDAKLINYLVRNYHTSPLEMAEIRMHIRMPIFVMRQWVRHRTANLNEYSGRYSEMVRLWYVPENEQICYQDKVNKQGSAEPLNAEKANIASQAIWEAANQSFNAYEGMLADGVSRETARIILPLNTYTEVVWKLDISNLLKFLRLRDDSHAQWEIRQYASLVSDAVREYFPLVFAAYAETREAYSLTEDEVYALITCNYDDLSASQAKRIAQLRDQIL